MRYCTTGAAAGRPPRPNPRLREAQGIPSSKARCRPVIASDVGGIPQVITSEVDGLLVPPASSSALADAIVRLALSSGLRRRLGEAGRVTVVSLQVVILSTNRSGG